MADFLFAVPSGEPVILEPFHTAIIGQTQFSGKTTLIKRLANWAATQGYTVLVFDSVPRYTPIIIKDENGEIDILPIEKLYESSQGLVTRSMLGEEIKKLSMPITTLSPNRRHEAVWRGRITKIIRHPYKGKLVRINTIAGLVDVSPNHSIIKAKPKEQVVDAKDIKVGDILSFLPIYDAVQKGGEFFGTKDLAWLYGLYCAEGWAVKKQSTSGGIDYGIYISNKDMQILQKAKVILEEYFHHPATITQHKDRVSVLEIHSKFVYHNFESKCGSRASDKKVPKEILNASSDVKQAFLDGYYAGDGYIGKYAPRFSTISQVLAMGVIWLQHSLSRNSWSVQTRDDKPNAIEVVFNKGSRNKHRAGTVKKIKEIDYEGWLYDLEVEGDDTFCAGIGPIRVHNTKETEADYEGFGKEVPVCLRETTDSFVLIGLLESMFKRRLTPYYATLSRLTETAKGFNDIISRAKQLEASTRSSWLRDACRVLYDLLERLKNETSKVETVQQLRIYPGINRMCINDFSLEAQQLIVKNAFEDALRIYKRKLILVIDEAFKFLPQDYSSAATRAVMNVITQGAKTGLYVLLATQFLAVTDKDPLKACAVKFLGTQDHITEVKHTLDLIPEARGKFTPDDIMKLKLGYWILVRKRPPFVGVVYSLPVGVPESVGVEVARGIRTPESVRDQYLKPKLLEVNDEMVWKEKYEQLEKQFANLRTQIYNELRAEFEKQLEEERQRYSNATARIKDSADKYYRLAEDYAKLKSDKEQLEAELKKLEPLKAFGEALSKFLQEILPHTSLTNVPSNVAVQHEVPALTVQVIRKPLVLSTNNIQGRLALLYAEGFFDGEERTISAVQKEIMRRGWSRDPRLSGFLDEMCSWGYLRKRKTDRWLYSSIVKASDAKQRGLLKEVEVYE